MKGTISQDDSVCVLSLRVIQFNSGQGTGEGCPRGIPGSDCSSEFVSTGARTRTARPQVNYALVHHCLLPFLINHVSAT